jgi:hypothetical protein
VAGIGAGEKIDIYSNGCANWRENIRVSAIGACIYTCARKWQSARRRLAADAVGCNSRKTDQVCRGFKIGDFDTVRAMLADDVKVDLVAKLL